MINPKDVEDLYHLNSDVYDVVNELNNGIDILSNEIDNNTIGQ